VKVCKTCPWRRSGGLKLTPGDAESLVSWLETERGAVAICHSDRRGQRECAGARAFLQSDDEAGTIIDAAEFVADQRKRPGKAGTLFGIWEES